jgi:hypothetical protein
MAIGPHAPAVHCSAGAAGWNGRRRFAQWFKACDRLLCPRVENRRMFV